MKLVALALVSLIPSLTPALARAQVSEHRFEGAAAEEMYGALGVAETEVRDEHGGPAVGVAKYGRWIGCEKLAGRPVVCWYLTDK
jgi:hypothetical protein